MVLGVAWSHRPYPATQTVHSGQFVESPGADTCRRLRPKTGRIESSARGPPMIVADTAVAMSQVGRTFQTCDPATTCRRHYLDRCERIMRRTRGARP